MRRGLLAGAAALLAATAPAQADADTEAGTEVEVLRSPGAQPHVAVDARGTVHAVFFAANRATAGERLFQRRGDVWYATRAPGEAGWSEPVRVNSRQDGATRISFPRLALGRDGRVHVAWVTMNPRGQWYTRSKDGGSGFEEQRNLLDDGAVGIENGPAVVADGAGQVFVVWHEGPFRKEAQRTVLVRRSVDGGATFAPARRANPSGLGVCACCGLDALLDPEGTLHVAFRAVRDLVHRDMVLLESRDGGDSFADRVLDEWELAGCPTALTSLAARPGMPPVVAWETEGAVYFGDLAGRGPRTRAPRGAGAVQKLPSVAVGRRGDVLLAWVEIDGGRRTLAWQLYNPDGLPIARSPDHPPIERISAPAVAARPDGGFVLVFEPAG